jgi:hypothetical protein
MYQTSLCMARKNMGSGINTQCSYKHKYGQYCGFHKTTRLRIDEPLPANYKLYLKKIKESGPHIKKLTYKLKIIHSDNIVNTSLQSNHLITLKNYMRGIHLKSLVKDLKYTLDYYKLSTQGKKQELINRLDKYFSILVVYNPHIDKITFLQKTIRKFLKQKHIKLKGPGYINRSLCINDYDFYTCDNKMDIVDEYFISYEDDKKFVYCFDIRSLQKLIETTKHELPINPFSMLPIPIKLIINNQHIIDDLKKKNIYIEFDEPDMSPEQLHHDKIHRLFHQLDELDNHTNSEWFVNLTVYKLKLFYNHLYEIWTIRADLTNEIRNRIVPNGPLFKMSINQVNLLKSKKKIQNIVMNIIQRLIESALTRSDNILGSLYVLTALSEVSTACSQAHPWLLQN